ncbi:MAG: UDP-N-acetylglucosamine 1-carboxyvinyltransferase [Clostridiales bacterium]|jgi:UDP-N-acetylglucosamine 1-carboxyvinyltransferase|nr:UDP-N-acetylglucosamine 1-carboxyvinyltransferase [Clostridiales bacterium]
MINGGQRLAGEVIISGSKNATLAIIAAACLCEGPVVLHNVPLIEDIFDMREILFSMGCKTHIDAHGVMVIEPDTLNSCFAVHPKMKSIRAASYFMGALVGRFRMGCVSMPGGCKIGSRPINYHLDGFEALGVKSRIVEDKIFLNAYGELTGGDIVLPYPSVGATVNLMIAAALAKGKTVIKNAAAEPNVVDAANFLVSVGADIKGIGTTRLEINGVKRLAQTSPYTISPDHIEAGTFMIYCCIAGGELTLKNTRPKDLEKVIATLREMGAKIVCQKDTIKIWSQGRLKAAHITTGPHPEFPTDLQQLMLSLMAVSEGVSTITETVFENRFQQAQELNHMGAKINIQGNTAVIEGVEKLNPSKLAASDLRGGAALVGAALKAKGVSIISGDNYISRGYQDIVGKLSGVNAIIDYYG